MSFRIERQPFGWSGFDRRVLAGLGMSPAGMLARIVEAGLEPGASCAAFALSAQIARDGIVVGPVAWKRDGCNFRLMVRDRMGRLWIGDLDRVPGSRHGWVFTTAQGPFDPDLDGDQVHPGHLEYHRTSVEGVAA